MRHVQLMIKPASSNCNLRCGYCFYLDECEKREVASYGIMEDGVLETTVKKALEAAEETCTFGFQGGEPTLAGLDFFRRFTEYVKRYKKPQTRTQFALQTNGTLLDGEWAEFFRKNHFLIGISLDGTKELHDKNRQDARGKGTFQRVLKNARLLRENQVEVNILCVLTRQSARKISSVYRLLKKEGFFYQQYIPCLDPLGEKRGGNPWSLTPKGYGEALKELFDLWFEDISQGRRISIREFDNWLAMLRGYAPEACSQVGRCSMQNIVEANGDVFPCDFYALDDYLEGNVLEEEFQFGQKKALENPFFREGDRRGEECPGCKWYPLCRGGCRRDYTEEGKNYFCPAYQEFFSYAIGRLEWLAARL